MKGCVKIGISGLGKVGKIFTDSITDNINCDLMYVFDPKLSARDVAPFRVASTPFSSNTLKEFLSSTDIGVVCICSPTMFHAEQCSLAAKFGKDILCEKPLARNVAECDEIIQAVNQSGVKLMVGFQLRFHPLVEAIDNSIHNLGKIHYAELGFGLYRPGLNWRHTREQGGGVMLDLGCHLFDLARRWLGTPMSVQASMTTLAQRRAVEDHGTALIEFENGGSASITCSWWHHGRQGIKGSLVGEKGTIEFFLSPYDPAQNLMTVFVDGKEVERRAFASSARKTQTYPGYLDAFHKELEHFIDCIVHDRYPIVTAECGRAAVALAEACYESQRLDKKVWLERDDLRFVPSSCAESRPSPI